MFKRGRSGLQKEVISLYRSCLRAVKTKPAKVQPQFREFVKVEFEKNLVYQKNDVATIEYLIRQGKKKLGVLASKSVISLTQK